MRIKIKRKQRDVFRPFLKNIDQLIADGDVTAFSEALIRVINDHGYNSDLSGMNSIGQQLQNTYYEIYRQNMKKPNIFVRWYLRRKDGEF